MKTNEVISIIDIAKQFGKQKQHIFKILKRLGIQTIQQKSNQSRGQKISYVNHEDFAKIKDFFANYILENETDNSDLSPDIGGVFYLIQLEPDHDPGRFKVGFATNIEERLRSHKTAAPFSKLVKTWPCKLLWEKTAIDCVSQNTIKIHTEVFRADSINQVLLRCEKFFELMPQKDKNG